MSDVIQLLPDHVANQIAAGREIGVRSREFLKLQPESTLLECAAMSRILGSGKPFRFTHFALDETRQCYVGVTGQGVAGSISGRMLTSANVVEYVPKGRIENIMYLEMNTVLILLYILFILLRQSQVSHRSWLA